MALALAVCSLLALPALARGVVTIGSSLPPPTEDWVCDGGDPGGSPTSDAGDFPCVMIQDRINGAFVEGPDGRGVITEWTVRGASGTIALRVLQAIEPYETGKLKAAMRNESVDVEASGGTESFSTRQRIYQADYIGLVLQDTSSHAGFSNVAYANPTELFEAPGAYSFTAFETSWASEGELLYRVKVEPDVNDNGCGDETQEHLCAAGGGGGGGGADTSGDGSAAEVEPDPLAGLRAGHQPGMRILGKKMKVSKKGFVKVTVANPNYFRLKGKLSLKSKRLRLGSKSFSIGELEASRTVRIKLSKNAFRALKRKRRLAVLATATGRGPIGKSRTVRKKLSFRAPSKPKKKRQGTGGGGGGDSPGLIFCPPMSKGTSMATRR